VTENDRIGTAILYLNEGFKGGETFFPELGLKVIPEKGSVLFFDYKYSYETNKKTLHAGLPVIEGTKYIATFWIRQSDASIT
jgi:prolyl 4-hydroxylase